ncbi:30 kDa heat shock protein [Pseudocercospora fuligena]|uniref:30 kDa heat shock protein n=1 Tax=Pseudocercospora fuligena TaxID=685502 RepID=A0A8H6RP26_9PEZI|nr:30 kDa heat shock protein [Pseudocercospora fuligena]
MSLFPRFVQDELASFQPLFRLADDYANYASRGGNGTNSTYISRSFKSFTPKFDVKETKEAYELHGELPGVQQKDINIEFTDAQTLTVKGRTEHTREEGTRPTGFIKGEEQGKITDGNDSNNYHKPSVEDEATMSGGNPDANQVQKSEQQPQQPQHKYWVSERSVGEFARTFSFPARVDQDNVKASLKDGILSIVVPKAPAPSSKRISIE